MSARTVAVALAVANAVGLGAPAGRPPSPRWRWVEWGVVGGAVLAAVVALVMPFESSGAVSAVNVGVWLREGPS